LINGAPFNSTFIVDDDIALNAEISIGWPWHILYKMI